MRPLVRLVATPPRHPGPRHPADSGIGTGQPTTVLDAIAVGPGPIAGTVISRPGSALCVRLAVSGWRNC